MKDEVYRSAGGGAGVAGAAEAWRGLALLANCRTGEVTGAAIASGLSRDGTASQSSLAIRNLLHEILTNPESDSDAASIVSGVSDMLSAVDPRILTAVLRAESDPERRVAFLDASARRLSVKAAVRLASGFAAANDRVYPAAVRTIIHGLARRALTLPPPYREEADALLREELKRLLRSWATRPRNVVTGGHEPNVERMDRQAAGRAVPEAERILEMAIECDATGGAVWLALDEVVKEGGMSNVIEHMKGAPEDSATATAIMKRIGTPQQLRTLLQTDPLDGAAVDALLRGMGLAAAKVMLEELVESTARITRRYLMDRLARFGPDIRPMVEGRLKDRRWFVQRNMLALLRSSKSLADSSTVARFLGHKDARIRREAVLWGLENPATRDDTLVKALADSDAAVTRPTLQAARSGLPSAAAPVLAKRILDSDFPPEFRVPAIGLLGRSDSVLALEALLHFAQNGTSLFGKPRLASKSPEMVAALSALARSWPSERRAAALIAQARKSRDGDIADALRATREAA